MSAIPARRRRRMITAVVTSVLTAIALPGGLVIGAADLLNDSGGNNVDNNATISIPLTPVEMLAITNSRNELASLALIAIDPSLRGGTIVSVPVGARADVRGSEAPRRIADSYTTGGLSALKTDVENLLNVSLEVADVVNAADLATVLAPIGSQPVSLPQAVLDTAADGTVATVLGAGSTTVTGQQVAASLAASQAGSAESTRLPQVKALWTAVARAGVATNADATATTIQPQDSKPSTPTSTAAFFSALLSGEVDVWQFGATLLVDAQRNPANADMYELDGGEVLTVMASVAPSAMRPTNTNISVMIDIPFDNTTYAKEAATRLAFMGANVVLIRHIPETPAEETVVYYNDTMGRVEAETFVNLLGTLTYKESLEIIDGVNLRIVLGNDFVGFLGSGPQNTTTTTVVK
ncbi:MAG: hypothetical protein RLY24_686 [Actinomycetota bacterium]